MKPKIHPKYETVTITCMGCKTQVTTRSTSCKDFTIDVCSSCHPFYTGRQKYVDSAGRIERFQKKWSKAGVGPSSLQKAKPAAAEEAKPEEAAKDA